MKCILIGAGMVAETHVRAIADNNLGITLHGVVGRDGVKLNAFAETASDILGYSVSACRSLGEALEASLDFAIVITPPNARMDICSELAEARIPVLMEKPIERNLENAQRLVGMFQDLNLPLGLVFQHRTRKASQLLKQSLESGDLGNILHVEMSVPWWRPQSYYDEPGRGAFARDGGGVMISQAIHTLDLGIWLCGRIKSLQSQMRTTPLHQLEAEDLATALLSFENGASGLITATTCAYPGQPESISIITTNGVAKLQGDQLAIQFLDGRTEMHDAVAHGTGGGADPMAFTHDWHKNILEDFAISLQNNNPPIAPASEALHVHAVIDAMWRAAKSEKTESVAQ